MKKVPSIEELRKICQPEGKRGGLRDISIHITRFLLHTPITANQVSLIRCFLQPIGAILFIFGNSLLALFGILAIMGDLILDFVDGEIARYRGTASPEGSFIDDIPHFVGFVIIFPCITFGVYQHFPQISVIILGCLATIAYVGKQLLPFLRDRQLVFMLFGQERVSPTLYPQEIRGISRYIVGMYTLHPDYTYGNYPFYDISLRLSPNLQKIMRRFFGMGFLSKAVILDLILGWTLHITEDFTFIFIFLGVYAILSTFDYIAKVIYIKSYQQIHRDYFKLIEFLKKK